MNYKDKKISRKTVFRLIKYIYDISPKYFILSLMFKVLMGFTSALSVWVLKILVNFISSVSSADGSSFFRVLIVYGTINVLVMIISSINRFISSRHSMIVDYKTDLDVLNKCRELTLKDFEDSESYNIIARAEREGRGKILMTYNNLLEIVKQLSSILSISFLILSWESYIFLLIFISPIISTIVNTRISYRNYKIRMDRMGDVRSKSYVNYLLTNDIACKEVKTYNIGSYLVDIFDRITLKIQNQDIKITKTRTLWNISLNIGEEIISIFVIFNVVRMAAVGQILIGDTVAYIDSLSIVQSNVSSFLQSLAGVYNNLLYVEEYYRLLDLEVEEENKRDIKINDITEIIFEKVSFTYKGNSSRTLSNINIKIKKGEVIAIVGENGSGKTTFIKLLCGFYDNYDGKILINGINLKQINTESLRKQMGIIFQDFNKYEFTLRENIAFGEIKSLDNDNKINSILEKINLKDKTSRYSKGLDTQMGLWFGGENLSKGQWQRIALGRAFIRDANMYILDEPTASLDPISEKEIFKLMLEQSNNKICLFITHRIENIESINPRVIVFSNGEIVEDSNHHDLKKFSFIYSKLLGEKVI